MKVQMTERDTFPVVGVRKMLVCRPTAPHVEIQKFWAQVQQDGRMERLLHLGSKNGQVNQLLGITGGFDEESNELEYWIAVEAEDHTAEGFSRFDVPAATWAVFEAVGPVAESVPQTWRRIYSEWLPANSYVHGSAPSLEVYKDLDPASPQAKTEIWVPVQKSYAAQ